MRDEEIHAIRRELYHSDGKGFHIFKGFLSDDEVTHMRHVWTEYDWHLTHTKFLGKANLTLNTPDQYYWDEERQTSSYWNFFWNNSKRCTYTQETCATIHMIKNIIMGKAPFAEFAVFKVSGHSFVASYRVANTFNSDTYMEEHVDWGPQEDIRDKRHQPARLQCTLVLGEHGKDYEGEGFYLTNKKGQRHVFGKDVKVKPGDLIIWPVNSPHGVGKITSLNSKIGFLRILFPSEKIDESRFYNPVTGKVEGLGARNV